MSVSKVTIVKKSPMAWIEKCIYCNSPEHSINDCFEAESMVIKFMAAKEPSFCDKLDGQQVYLLASRFGLYNEKPISVLVQSLKQIMVRLLSEKKVKRGKVACFCSKRVEPHNMHVTDCGHITHINCIMSIAYHGSKKCPTCDYVLNSNKEYLKLSYQSKKSVDAYLDREKKLAIIREREEREEFIRSVCEKVEELEKEEEEEVVVCKPVITESKPKKEVDFLLVCIVMIVLLLLPFIILKIIKK